MSSTTRPMTADELLRLPRGKARYELVKGELITMSPAGEEHGAVIMNLAVPLGHHIKTNDLGVIYGAETGFKLSNNPDTVRAPDIAFVSRHRIERVGIKKGFREGAPDLAVEVLSPGDSFDEVYEKVEEWLAAGTVEVWIVSPKRRNVTVYRSLTDVRTYPENEEIAGGEVVPGFRCKVSEIFV